MLRRLVVSLVATKSCRKATKHVVSWKLSVVVRFFYFYSSYRSNCDFGGPCNCTECMGIAKRPICEVCKVDPTVNQSSELYCDRKGTSSYNFTSFCEQCWEKYIKEKKKREWEKEQVLALRKKRLDKMMKDVKELHFKEQVPIRYAVERLLSDIQSVKNSSNSQRWHQRHLVDFLSQDLQIVKVRNRYMCNKQQVDAMDFKLWFFYESPDVDV